MKPYSSHQKRIKDAQRESLYFREISSLFMRIVMENDKFLGLSVIRVSLAKNGSLCNVHFYTDKGKDYFNSILKDLTLYKPSIRSSIASHIQKRYTPDLRFIFDNSIEKEFRINTLLDRVSEEESKDDLSSND